MMLMYNAHLLLQMRKNMKQILYGYCIFCRNFATENLHYIN